MNSPIKYKKSSTSAWIKMGCFITFFSFLVFFLESKPIIIYFTLHQGNINRANVSLMETIQVFYLSSFFQSDHEIKVQINEWVELFLIFAISISPIFFFVNYQGTLQFFVISWSHFFPSPECIVCLTQQWART